MNASSWILEKPLALHRSHGKAAMGSLLFAVFTAMGAAVSLPLVFSPVPITLQTLAVVMAGAVLGPVWGPISQLMYLGAGMSGLPVFAGGQAGAHILFGPTGGYLAGFVLASWIAGLTTRPGGSWVRLVSGMLAAHAVIFVFGLSQLMVFTGQSLPAALALGFFPFVPGLLIKTAAAAGLLRSRKVTGWFRS